MKPLIYLLSKAFFYFFTAFFGFVIVFSILAFAEQNFGWDVPFVKITEQNGNPYAAINVPLIGLTVGFIFKAIVVLVMWLGLLFYVIYFYTLKAFFKVFVTENTFSKNSMKRLYTFFYINLIPLVYALVISVYQIIKNGVIEFEEDQGVAIFHLFIAFIIYFYIDLAKKGSVLQEENDLTI